MPDAPTNWDLQRLIERNHSDSREDILDLKTQVATQASHIAAELQRFVLREVYEAREAAMLARIGRLEEEAKTHRGQLRSAVYASVGSVVAAIATAIILAVILKGGKP